MPKNLKFKSSKMIAACIMRDDWFRMGGRLYRVTDVRMNDYGNPVITFRPAFRSSAYTHTLIVGRDTKFRIYNQK